MRTSGLTVATLEQAPVEEVWKFYLSARTDEVIQSGVNPADVVADAAQRSVPVRHMIFGWKLASWVPSRGKFGRLVLGTYGVSGLFLGARPGVIDPGANVVDAVYLGPDARGTGTADDLLDEFHNGFADPTVPTRLRVFDGNLRAQRLYARHGYASTDHSNMVLIGERLYPDHVMERPKVSGGVT